MLVAEDKMIEGEGVLLTHPADGCGYQCAGALQRLGRRMIGLLRSDVEQLRVRHVPMQHAAWEPGKALPEAVELSRARDVLFTPEPELGSNRPLSPEKITQYAALFQELQAILPQPRFILVLPESMPEADVERLSADLVDIVTFFTPALYGFRDNGALDHALELLTKSPDLLLKDTQRKQRLTFAGDIAAYVVALPNAKIPSGTRLAVPATTESMDEWLKTFRTSFAVDNSWLDRLTSRLGRDSLLEGLDIRNDKIDRGDLKTPQDFFPSMPTRLQRSLDVCALHFRKKPEVQLLFPPGHQPGG